MFKNVCVVEIFSFHSNIKKNEYVFSRSISRNVCFVGISYVYDLRAGCFSYIIFIYSICVRTNVYGAFTKSSSSIQLKVLQIYLEVIQFWLSRQKLLYIYSICTGKFLEGNPNVLYVNSWCIYDFLDFFRIFSSF